MAEERLAQCQEQKCSPRLLSRSIYHTIPAKIHRDLVESLEFKSSEKIQRMVDVLLYNAQNSEVVAYPHRSEYADEPLILGRSIEPNNSKTPMRVKFDPDVLDFGIRFLIYVRTLL